MALELDRNSGFVSLRRSLIWYTEGQTQIAPDADVVVIVSSKTGYFVDVRFLKESGDLEWAFAGYKENGKNQETRFVHLIDSRTIDVSQVEDIGISSQHPTDLTLTYERGRMLNPGTSKLEDFEELWSDEQPQSVLILRSQNENTATQEWIAQSDTWQIGIIRTGKGVENNSLTDLKVWMCTRMHNELVVKHIFPDDTNGEISAHEFKVIRLETTELGPQIEWEGKVWEVLS